MIRITLCIAAVFTLASPAAAQIQGGPNIAPNGTRFTYSPRFGYLGPPAAFVPDPPPPPSPYYRPGSMPTIKYPREPLPPIPPPLASPPMPPIERPAAEARRTPRIAPAARAPGQRRPPAVPCPRGCPRGPDDPRPSDPID
jgi:hypothetical protein